LSADDLHLLAKITGGLTALLLLASGYFWWASARDSRAAEAQIRQMPRGGPFGVMAPGAPGAVSTDWLSAFTRTQKPVQKNNTRAAWFAAGAGIIGMIHEVIGLF
jgi:hypothetical protein